MKVSFEKTNNGSNLRITSSLGKMIERKSHLYEMIN